MKDPKTRRFIRPDAETLQTWEDMRIEILHELQEGASADVPDSELDNIGNLVVTLKCLKSHQKTGKLQSLKHPKDKLASSKN